MIAIRGGGTLSIRRLGRRLLFCINGIPNNDGDWWKEPWDFQKLITADAGASIRVSPVWTTGGNQINLGTGVAYTSLIELLSMFYKCWVEEVITEVSWVCPVAPVWINSTVATLEVGIDK